MSFLEIPVLIGGLIYFYMKVDKLELHMQKIEYDIDCILKKVGS